MEAHGKVKKNKFLLKISEFDYLKKNYIQWKFSII